MTWTIALIPDQGQYRPGAVVHLELRGTGPASAQLTAELHVTALGRTVAQDSITLQSNADGNISAVYHWPLPETGERWTAWGVDLWLHDAAGEVIARTSTALDCAPHWRVAPRYGFLSDFAPHEQAAAIDAKRLEALRRLHLTCLQFYDWMYTHYRYLPPTPVFTDPLGRVGDMERVRDRAAACIAQGMAPIAYASVYGGEQPFAGEHPDWQLYDGDRQPMSLAGLFFIQDPSPDSGWRQHLLGEYQAALELGFLGLHCDTYGSPKFGIVRRNGEERVVHLEKVLPSLLAEAENLTRAHHELGGAIFNCVGGWPIDVMAKAPAAALYIEVWPPNAHYRDLYETVMRARRLDPTRQIVLAAYLPAFHREHERPTGALTGLRLASATIFASGGFHLLPGEGTGVLADAYYPLFGELDDQAYDTLRRYWDFQTRYGPLLADLNALDMTTTLCGGINREVRVEGAPTSSDASPDSVWTICKQGDDYLTLHLINLTAVDEPRWTAPQPEPIPTAPLTVRFEVLGAPRACWWASPDLAGGQPQPLEYRLEYEQNVGLTLVTTLPAIQVWSMLVLEP